MRVIATDADGDWDVGVGPDGVTTRPGGSRPSDATVRGEASDLDQALWNRPVTGDPAVLAVFLDKVHVRWT